MLKFSEFSEEILLELNYKHYDPTDVDTKLIHRALHSHMSNFSNFIHHKMAGNDIQVKDLQIPSSLKTKYSNTKIAFPKMVGQSGYYDQKKEKRKILGINLPSTFDKQIHHIGLEVNGDNHKDFLHNLKHNSYHILRHELEHHNDPNLTRTNVPIGSDEYYNTNNELKAFMAEKKHQIHRSLIQNNTDLYSKDLLGHLPLKDRLKRFSNADMIDKLAIIDRHSPINNGHHSWYNKLNSENRKIVDSYFQPIIDRHIGT